MKDRKRYSLPSPITHFVLLLFTCLLLAACPQSEDIHIRFQNNTNVNLNDLKIIWPASKDQYEDYTLFSGNLSANSTTSRITKHQVPPIQLIKFKVDGILYEVKTEPLHSVLTESANITYGMSFANQADPKSLKVTAEIILED